MATCDTTMGKDKKNKNHIAMKINLSITQDQSARLIRCGVSADTADMIGIEPNYGCRIEAFWAKEFNKQIMYENK